MDQEKIGKFILELRKRNNLTQKQFADKFGVTYQAVSKWENGKNIPDISIIKNICEEFDININEILDVKENKKEDKKKSVLMFILLFFELISIVIIQSNHSNNSNFEFKTIETKCDNFNISGSVAYNSSKSSIYISNVEYCGSVKDIKYKTIECNLYDIENNKEIKVSDCGYKNESAITLEEYLKNVKFNIDDYKATCKDYKNNRLELEINATNEKGMVTTYKIPLELKDNCKK